MEQRIQVATNCYIQPTHLILTPQFEASTYNRSRRQKLTASNLQNNKTNGKLSTKAVSKLKNSINWLIHSAQDKRVYVKASNQSFKFKVNFITLTIPPQSSNLINAKEFQQCLNVWLVYARKYFYLKNYVWKVERHQDNRLHIHITSDTFINYKLLRDSWNRILQKRSLLDEHYIKFKNYNPNSTDIHAIYKVKNVGAYLAKYMSKSPDFDKSFNGRLWGSSKSISNCSRVHIELSNTYNIEDFGFLNESCIEYKKIQSLPDMLGKRKHLADMFFIKGEQWKSVVKGRIKDAYVKVIKAIRDCTPTPPKEYLSIDLFGQLSKVVLEVEEKVINLAEQCQIINTKYAKNADGLQMSLGI